MLQGPAVMNLHQNTKKDDVSLKKNDIQVSITAV